MTFSGIAVEQRSKETNALRLFLVYSLIGSVVLHIGILTIGIGTLLRKTSEVEAEPLEVTIIDAPTVETEPTPQKIKPEPKPEPETASPQLQEDVSNNREFSLASQPQIPVPPVAIAPLKLETEPVKKFSSNLKTPPVQQQSDKTSTTPEKPQSTTQPNQVENTQPVNTQQTTAQSGGQGSEKLRDLLSERKNTRASQGTNSNTVGGAGSNVLVGSDNGTPVGTGNGIGIGNGIGNGSGNGIGNGNGTGNGNGLGTGNTGESGGIIATGSRPGRTGTPQTGGSSQPASTGNGRAACRECGIKYPEAARTQGIQGKVGVAVDTDEKGNVINVRIVKPSGNRDLDEETLRQARNWKLKPSTTGRQGVTIETEYAIRGSRRYRALQERKRQRQAQTRQQSTTEEASSSPQSASASNNTDAPEGSNTENHNNE